VQLATDALTPAAHAVAAIATNKPLRTSPT
jgi:hypothetical protein